jgi:hypothetical protein
MKKVRGRRLGVCGKPVTHWFMQLLDLFLRDLGQAASKPLARESEADCLHSSQRFIVALAPAAPKFAIGVALEKTRDLVDVRRPRVPAQKMTHSMCRGIAR